MRTLHINIKRIFLLSTCVLMLSAWPTAWAADTYEVDPAHSTIAFKVRHLAISWVSGRFNHAEGTIMVDEKNPTNSSVDIYVKAKHIDTGNEERDKHLRSPDFFHAEKYPDIRFVSTSVKKTGDESYEVFGNLTMHGKTLPQTVVVERTGSGKDPWGGFRMGFETSFKVKRSAFGMKPVAGVGEEVRLTITIESVRK